MLKTAAILWLFLLAGGIIAFYWHIQWVYTLPTPVPKHYLNVYPGQMINIPASLKLTSGKPLLMHFFNPDCPCSKFNIEHFKSIVKHYGEAMDFAVVPVSDKPYTTTEIQKTFHMDIPVLLDTSIAAHCGVYSTPQAVIVDGNRRLYYRGNYNKSRYCTDKKTNYAMMAIDSLLIMKNRPVFDQYALEAYGCQLPAQ